MDTRRTRIRSAVRPWQRSRRGWLACVAIGLGLGLGVGAGLSPAAGAETAEPASDPSGQASRTIDALHAVLIDVMKNADSLGYEGRAKKLTPAIPRYYDVAFMAEKSVGRHWDQADPGERERFLATFLRFMVANYAGQFDGYSGQRFETLSEEPARMDTVLVKSVLVDPKGENVDLNYLMRKVDGAWKVIDVYLDGTVSELALRRSEFSGIVKREDFDGLIAALDERIEKLASGTES
jgi:phospholipid transport system substrate-binding protein